MSQVAEMPTEDSRRRWALRSALAAVLGAGLLLTACSKQQSESTAPPAQATEQTAQAQPATPPASDAAPAAEAAPAPAHQHTPGMQMTASEPHVHAAGQASHQDHESKHGGDFFMALDEKHHLEGVLAEPGTFRVYLFDEYTKPLSKQSVAKADAKVTWGKAANAPEIALKPSADGLTLEAQAPAKVTFPTELTLRIRFPGAAAGSRPELFTFPFKAYTHDPTTHKH
jgi:hypothetical protein